MRKGNLIAAILLASTTLAACNRDTNDEETPMQDDQSAGDIVTPYDNDNGTIDGVNNSTNGSDRGLYMNGDNANVEAPTTNKDNNGANFNGGNNMNGAGGNNGNSGNNTTNDRGLNNQNTNDITDPDVNNTGERIKDDAENVIDETRDRLDKDINNR